MALPGPACGTAQQQLGKGLRPAHPRFQLQRISHAVCTAHYFSVQRNCCKSADDNLEALTAWCLPGPVCGAAQQEFSEGLRPARPGLQLRRILARQCMVQDCASQLHKQHLHDFCFATALTTE